MSETTIGELTTNHEGYTISIGVDPHTIITGTLKQVLHGNDADTVIDGVGHSRLVTGPPWVRLAVGVWATDTLDLSTPCTITQGGDPVTVEPFYNYRAVVDRWVDGDTVDLEIDLGFNIHQHHRCRLLDIDTPERGRPGFGEATAEAERLAPPGSTVLIFTDKLPGKYGRYLVTVYTVDGEVSVNQHLLDTGHAIVYGSDK